MSQNPHLPQNAPWVSTDMLAGPFQVLQNPPGRFAARRGNALRTGMRPRLRTQNPSALGWAGIGLGAAALAGGAYWLWHRRRAAETEAQTGVSVSDDCTMFTLVDAEVGTAYFRAFADARLEDPVDPSWSLLVAQEYLAHVAPQCVDVTSWQKAAITGGLALLIANRLHDEGVLTDEVFKQQTEDIQAYLLANGVTDLAKIEEVFVFPSGSDTTQPPPGGAGGPGDIAANWGGRAPNMGLVGWGLLGLGAAAAGGGGYLWWRNRKLTEACLGDQQWFEADGSLSETAELELETAMEEAIADGMTNAVDVADAAIIELSGDPDCRLPRLVWGDLLRVRAAALAKAALLLGGEEISPETEEGPGPEITGLEVNAMCDHVTVRNQDRAEAYIQEFLADYQAGMSWTPSSLTLGAQYAMRIAPHCGIQIAANGEIIGVDTWQKAAIVGAFALLTNGILHARGVLTDEERSNQSLEITQWLLAHGVDDLQMLEEVSSLGEEPQFTPGGVGGDGDTGFQTGQAPLDDWGEPPQNNMVDNGSVGGEGGGLWRVYKDNVGEYGMGYYFKTWEAGEYTEMGDFETAEEAKQAAIDWLLAVPAGIAGNPRHRAVRARRGRETGVHTRGDCPAGTYYCGKSSPWTVFCAWKGQPCPANTLTQRSSRTRNPLPKWCPSSITKTEKGSKWCFDPKTKGWICAEPGGHCNGKGAHPWSRITARLPRPSRTRLVQRMRARRI